MSALAPEQYRFRVPGLVPADRLRLIIERRWTRRGRTIEELAERSGVTSRTLRAIMNDERPSVRFGSADKLVTALDVWLWQTSPPNGLADLWPVEKLDLSAREPYDPRNGNAPAAQQRSGARPQGGSP